MVEACRSVVLQRLAHGVGRSSVASAPPNISIHMERAVHSNNRRLSLPLHFRLYTRIPSYISCFGLTYIVLQA
jgi:hypothetical protein